MKLGIIYCPKHAGLKSISKRWCKIADSLTSHGVEYDLIQSESSKSVERLVNMLIHNGYDTIVMAGGDSALNDAVNCLMKQEKAVRESIVLGVIPNGLINDFASFWGFTEKDIDGVVASIKARRIRKVDVGCLYYTDKEGVKNTRYFLNCINIGLIAAIQRLKKQTREVLWSRKISYIISLILLAFQKMQYKLKYTINYETEEHRLITMCIGNAYGYGQTPNAVPYNGLLDVSAVKSEKITQLFAGIALFLRGKILNHKNLLPYRARQIEVLLPIKKDTPVSVDGRLISVSTRHTDLLMNVEEEAINFLIEK